MRVVGRVSTVAVQRFCKPKVGGSNPSPGTISMSGAAMTMRKDWVSRTMKRHQKSAARALAAVFFYGVVGATAGVAQVAPAPSDNPFNDQLLKLSTEQRGAARANHLGMWCIGVKPFYMGMTKGGAAKGYAYWSITCAGGQSY